MEFNTQISSPWTQAEIPRPSEPRAKMNSVILACYGWDDLNPAHGFYHNDRGQARYAISPDARWELLQRPLGPNLSHRIEVRS